MDRRVFALVLGMIACKGSSQRVPLYPAGSERDEGHGLLAHVSTTLITSDERDPDVFGPRPQPVPRRYQDDEGYGGDMYGGDSYGGYGGAAYGGPTYANYVPPPWGYPTANRMATYTQRPGLTATIEGVVSWRGAIPKVTTSCGTIAPLAIANDRAVAGIVVYIERVSVGRTLPHTAGEQRPSTVGGTVVKRGCGFAPGVQLVTPVPAALAIHGDATPTALEITLPGGTTKAAELQEAGRVVLQTRPGVTRIAAADGTLAAAYVLGLDTPYYAITDDHGRFRIEALAPGSYELTVWQPPIPTVVSGRLVYGAPVQVKRAITVGVTRPTRLDVTLGS